MVSVGDIVRGVPYNIAKLPVWGVVLELDREGRAWVHTLENHRIWSGQQYAGRRWWIDVDPNAGEPPDHIIAMAMRLALTEGVGV